MTNGIQQFRVNGSRRSRLGFTLLELLTALAVLSVAATVFFRLFASSNALADSSQSHQVAAHLAEEYIATIHAAPELFHWPNYSDAPIGELQLIKPREGTALATAAGVAEPPEAMPTIQRAFRRDRNLYQDFDWEAYARLPEASAQYVEVTVEIIWTRQGRVRKFSITSTIPRTNGEGVGS